MESMYTMEALQARINSQQGVLLYLSSESCSVCKVLKPKVSELLQEKFPRMQSLYVDIEKSPVIAGQFRVFTIPTVLLYFDGKEQVRFSRNIGMHQLEAAIERPYDLVFGD